MSGIFNFCAGPAMLPPEVMVKAQQEFINWQDTGCSVMELSHRSKEFVALANQAEADLRHLLNIPENYKVLFLPWRRPGTVFCSAFEPAYSRKIGGLYRFRLLV